jgi:hypothetical protein
MLEFSQTSEGLFKYGKYSATTIPAFYCQPGDTAHTTLEAYDIYPF